MRIEGTLPPVKIPKGPHHNQSPEKFILATGTGIDVRIKGEARNAIKKNDPRDPTVATKILDSLDLGIINFSQRERDALAKILMGQAEKIDQEK